MRTAPHWILLVALGLPFPVHAEITLEPLGTYATGLYDQVAAEIGAHDPLSQRLFVTNAASRTVDVLDMSDPRTLSLLLQIPLADHGAGPTSVAFRNGLGAVAVVGDPRTAPGRVVFFTSDGAIVSSVMVGALPDSVQFTPDGKKLVVANEGEPSDDYTIDPVGSISIIDVSGGGASVTQASVRTAAFTPFDGQKAQLRARGVRIYGPRIEEVAGEGGAVQQVLIPGGASVAQDIEPEFVSVSADSRTAFVTLQENNALAVVDLNGARVRKILPFGGKSHVQPENALDPSDRDGGARIQTWPVRGMYLPDAIATFQIAGQTYLITANEGDTRDWDGFSEEERVKDLTLGAALSLIPDLQKDAFLGRLKVTNSPPDGKQVGAGPDGEDVYRRLHSFGARSFSIWSPEGALLFDSGDEIERVTSERLGEHFNSDNASSPSGDSRSDDKGPEPEAVAVGEVNGKVYGFIGLERPGGIVIYDLSQPRRPRFVDYVNNRDFSVAFDIEDCAACEDDCAEDCSADCGACREACRACEECPEGEDCSGECALCAECEPGYSECSDCSGDCPAVQDCIGKCAGECSEENCPLPGVPGRDPLDLGPEGVIFVPASASPPGFGPLVIVTNEVSGSTTVYQVVEKS